MSGNYKHAKKRERKAEDRDPGVSDHSDDEFVCESNFGKNETNIDDVSSSEENPCLTSLHANGRKTSASEEPPSINASSKFHEGNFGAKGLSERGNSKRGRSFEDGVRSKLGLTHFGYLTGLFLLCVALLFLLVIIVLGSTWPRVPHWQQYLICTESPCLRSSELILSKLDRTKSPCEDFYGFANGKWMEKYGKPPTSRWRWGFPEEMDLKTSEMILDVIAVLPHQTRTNNLTWKIRNFYDSCMSLDDLENDGNRPLLKIINKLGGWSVLRNFEVMSWEVSKTLVKLYEEYDVQPFFSIAVVVDPRNATRNMLKLTPSKLGLPDISYYYREKSDEILLSYGRYMKDVAIHLGATSTDASSFAEDMFYFERRIAEFIPSAEELTGLHKFQVHNLTTLKLLAPSVPLHELLEAVYKSHINDNTEILLPSTYYLSKISNIIATIDRRALNNYIIWKLVKKYVPYLNQNFQNIHSVYNRESTGASSLVDRWEFCVKTLELFMDVGLVAQIELSESYEVRKRNIETVNFIFENLRQTIRERISKAEWIDLDLYKHFTSKLDNVTVEVGLTEKFLNSAYLKEYYSELYVEKNNFFQNILHGVSFLQEENKRKYVSSKDESVWLSSIASETKVIFLPSFNKIIIPQRLLYKPYFESGYPMPVLYGTLGVQISEALVSSLFDYPGLYAANGSLISENNFLFDFLPKSTDYQRKCLIDLSVNNEIATELAANKTSLNTFTTVLAVKQTLRALKKVMETREHIHQAGLEDFDDESLFYIAYGQSLFTSKTTQEQDRENTVGTILDGKQLLKVLKYQLKSFGENFNCGSPQSACKYIL